MISKCDINTTQKFYDLHFQGQDPNVDSVFSFYQEKIYEPLQILGAHSLVIGNGDQPVYEYLYSHRFKRF